MAFNVISVTNSGFDKIILKDEGTQAAVEIIPACGAILHAFIVFHNGKLMNVVDGYASDADFADHVENKGFKSCKLSPFACRIKNAVYKFAEQEYTVDKYLSAGNALHGLLYDAPFTVIHKEATNEKAMVALTYAYKGGNSGYPFKYDCIVTYTLTKENTLRINTEIVNRDEGLIPMQDGWHPYFTFGGTIDDLQLEFQSKEQIVFDATMIPTGETVPYQQYGSLKKIGATQFDDCFSINFAECQPACILRDAANKMQIEIHPDKSYPYLQIYTPPHRNSIAIENLSAIPDAFNNGIGLITLAPQATKSFTTTYKITLLK